MPAALERNLRSLPWVDEPMMQRLREPPRLDSR
jgi:hypothetical protein